MSDNLPQQPEPVVYISQPKRRKKLVYFLLGLLALSIVLFLGFILIPKFSSNIKYAKEIKAVNQIIFLIQNPDPALVTKLDLDPVRLDEDQKRLVYGFFGKAGSETNYAPESLYGLQDLIQEGKIEEAKKLLKKPLINYLTGPVSSRDIEARNDSGEWNEQQLEKYDPRELVFPWRKRQYKVQGISRIKEQALIQASKLYYGL